MTDPSHDTTPAPSPPLATSAAGLTDADRQRVAAALEDAASPNTRRAYRAGWERWQAWATGRGAPCMPADPAAVAAYLTERAERGAAPATVRMDRAAIAAAHRAAGAVDPTAHEGVRQVLHAIGKAGRDRGRGQVQGVDWRSADLAAALAANGDSLAGLRDAALILTGSDALLRVSEIAALNVADIASQPNGAGTVTVRSSKTDPEGRGHVRFLGAPTIAAIAHWRQAAGIDSGALFRSVGKSGRVGRRLDTSNVRRIIKRRAVDAGVSGRVSGHSLRVGSAQSLATAGAGLVALQQAGDWQSPQMPAHYARHQLAARGAVAKLRYGASE